MRTSRLVLATALFTAVGFGTVSPARAASKNQACHTVTAGGESYSISATNASCAVAQKWVAKLAGKRLKSHASRSALSHGPSGYTCVAGTAPSGSDMKVAANVQISGNCAKGSGLGNSPYFNWSIQNAFG